MKKFSEHDKESKDSEEEVASTTSSDAIIV